VRQPINFATNTFDTKLTETSDVPETLPTALRVKTLASSKGSTYLNGNECVNRAWREVA